MSFDFGSTQESDPTADFLARERAAAGSLGGDADLFGSSHAGTNNSLNAASARQASMGQDRDFEHAASAFPALDGEDDGFGGPAAASAPAPANHSAGLIDDDGDDFLGGGSAGPAASASKPSDERSQFERNFPELDEPEEAPAPSSNGFMAAPVASNYTRPAQTTTSYGASADPYGLDGEDEPEPVRVWREKQQEEIATREATAEREKAETISKAEQDIDNFYSEYNRKKEKTIASNKEEEAKFTDQRKRELAEGTTWSRVTKLVDLQNSQSKTIAKSGPGSTDLTRMKEILLSLRREGETAPGAGGY